MISSGPFIYPDSGGYFTAIRLLGLPPGCKVINIILDAVRNIYDDRIKCIGWYAERNIVVSLFIFIIALAYPRETSRIIHNLVNNLLLWQNYRDKEDLDLFSPQKSRKEAKLTVNSGISNEFVWSVLTYMWNCLSGHQEYNKGLGERISIYPSAAKMEEISQISRNKVRGPVDLLMSNCLIKHLHMIRLRRKKNRSISQRVIWSSLNPIEIPWVNCEKAPPRNVLKFIEDIKLMD